MARKTRKNRKRPPSSTRKFMTFLKPLFLEAQEHRCVYCSIECLTPTHSRSEIGKGSYDHIIPYCYIPANSRLTKKDEFAMRNLVIACTVCNRHRSDTLIEDYIPEEYFVDFMRKVQDIHKKVFQSLAKYRSTAEAIHAANIQKGIIALEARRTRFEQQYIDNIFETERRFDAVIGVTSSVIENHASV